MFVWDFFSCNAVTINNNSNNFEKISYIAQLTFLKASKFQKQIFLFSFEPKTKLNYFLISALRN